LVDDLLLDNPDAAESTLVLLQASLTTGDTATALQLLPALAADMDDWFIEDVSASSAGAIWIWYEDGDLAYSVLLVPGPAGTLHTIIASFVTAPDQHDVRAAMLAAASTWKQ